jgi:hypothetical protein
MLGKNDTKMAMSLSTWPRTAREREGGTKVSGGLCQPLATGRCKTFRATGCVALTVNTERHNHSRPEVNGGHKHRAADINKALLVLNDGNLVDEGVLCVVTEVADKVVVADDRIAVIFRAPLHHGGVAVRDIDVLAAACRTDNRAALCAWQVQAIMVPNELDAVHLKLEAEDGTFVQLREDRAGPVDLPGAIFDLEVGEARVFILARLEKKGEVNSCV